MKNIYLCGFMGCGKSTVGKELAKLLGAWFLDMDSYIESYAGETVSEIFKNHGEEYFRALEKKAAEDFSKRENLVVGTGGGAVLNSDNVEAFKKSGIIVFIDVPLKVIAKRLSGNTSRPLLLKPDKDEVLKKLYAERLPKYRAAGDIIVKNSSDMPALQVAENIKNITLNRLKKKPVLVKKTGLFIIY